MIYEFRTYNLRTGKIPEYHEIFKKKIVRRQEYSKISGHWYTETGSLNQMVAIWPYESLQQRKEIRELVETVDNGSVWPPESGNIIIDMTSEIYLPTPFMRPLEPKNMGPLYEIRYYSYPQELIPDVIDAWGKAMPKREELSPLVGCWYSDFGGTRNFVSLWSYKNFEQRLEIRAKARESGWPPKDSPIPTLQENKIMWPAKFSPLQ